MRSSVPLREPLERPLGMLTEQGVRPRGESLHTFYELPVAGISSGDKGVAAQVAGVVAREVQAVVARRELVVARFQPFAQGDNGLRSVGKRSARVPFLDATIPGTDVLADVAAVNLGGEIRPVPLRDRGWSLCPVREATGRVELPRLVECARRAGVDAARARAAVERKWRT